MTRTSVSQLATKWLIAAALGVLLSAPVQAFHFPWDQGHDTTDWNEPPPDGPCEGPLCTCSASSGSPVYIPTGHFYWRDSDFEIFGRQPLSVYRTYNSHDPRQGIFGNGWTSGCEEALLETASSETNAQGGASPVTKYVFRLSDGKRYEFVTQADGSIAAPAGREERLVRNADGTITLTETDGSTKRYARGGKLLVKTDRQGESLTYGYDGSERLIRISDGHSRFITLAYNTGGRVATVTDFTGRVWSYQYDSNGNLISVTNPLGGQRRYEYQPYSPASGGERYFQLTKIADETGVVLTSVVYSGDRVSSYTELANRFTFAYNTTTRTVTKTDTVGSRWTFVYDASQVITREVDPSGSAVVSTYDANGNLINTVDEDGRAWAATYDAQGRPLSQTDPLGNTLRSAYTGTHEQPTRITSPSGRVTAMEYDSRGNLLKHVDSGGRELTNTWSAAGILLSTTDAMGATTTFASDALGRRVTTTDPLGRTSTVVYDDLSRVIAENDGNGNSTSYNYDALGRVVSVIDRHGATVEYGYDPAGRLTSMRDERGNTASYAYDSFGRLVSRTAPDGRVTARSYAADNTLTSVTHPGGASVTFTYNANKRVSSRRVGAETYTYTYDKRHNLTRALNSSGELTRAYDAAGQLIGETFAGIALSFTLNPDGERTQLTALGSTTQYQRDNRGLISSIGDVTGTYQLAYDENGLRTSLRYPNGTVAAYSRDADRQITSIAHSGVFSDTRNYSYDNRGNIVSQTVNGAPRTFSFDAEERLVSATYPTQTFAYAYDNAGNITTDGRVHDGNNRLSEDVARTFTYDARGNLVMKGDKTTGARVQYEWDAQNQLIKVSRFPNAAATVASEVIEYRYDPLGRRTSKTVNGVRERYVYDGFNRIGTLNAAGAVLERVVFGPEIDEPLGMTSSGGNRYLHSDRQKSIVAMSDSAAVLEEFSYAPYGALLTNNLGASDFGYTGREMDGADIYFYRARYYDPTTQRFLSEDPIGLNAGTNFYAYVDGNPVGNTDPLGLQKGSPGWCQRQLERIRNIEKEIEEREQELLNDKWKLPETCPGDDKKPSLSREGHRRLINAHKENLVVQQALYEAYCRNNPPPPPVPVTEPGTEPETSPSSNNNPSSGLDWGAVAVGALLLIGIGAAIYFSGGLAAPALASSRRRKRDFAALNKEEILKKVVALDVGSWRYTAENRDIRHIGPMAEDFYEAFGLGSSDKTIAIVDTNGVLYAAVQALYAEMHKKDAMIKALEAEVARLRDEIELRKH